MCLCRMIQRAMDSKRVKRLRKALKMTQEQFAEKLGVSRVSVARWEAEMAKPWGLSLKVLRELERRTRRGKK